MRFPDRSVLRSRGTAGLAAIATVVAGSVVLVADAPPVLATATGGSYVAVSPSRVVDTRSGLDGHHGTVRAHTAIAFKIGGHGGVPKTGVSAAAVTITVMAPTAAGTVTAFATGHARPGTVAVSFAPASVASAAAIVPLSSSGSLDLYNGSAGSAQFVVDISGYYLAGTSSAAGGFHPVPPARVVDTRDGHDGNRKGALGAGAGFSALLGGHDGIPSSGVAAVAMTITVLSPTRAGHLVAYQYGAGKPADPTVLFAAGRAASAFAVVPVASGRISLANVSSGTIQVALDVTGYYASGVPTLAGTFVPLPQSSVIDTRYGTGGNRKGALSAGQTITARVGGLGGLPVTGAAAVLTVTDRTPSARTAGVLTAWPGGTGHPGVNGVVFAPGQSTTGVVVVPLSATGTIELRNQSSGSVQLLVAVDGYLRTSTITAPAPSTSRYVRNIDGGSGDVSTMTAEGAADAASGSTLVLLDIGAQTNDGLGVELSTTSIRLTYGELVTDLNAYLAGFGSVAGATVAVGTNNDATFTTYTGTQRGTDWADLVINQLTPGAGVTVVGADDIEAGFNSTEAQAQQWETGYLAATAAGLIYNGSADGCPTTFGSTGKTCNRGWTEAQYYALTHNGSRIRVLPQVYLAVQAVQWANIDATGARGLVFAGSLTERASCSTVGANCPTVSFTAAAGWAALRNALATVVTAPTLPAATDLRTDG